MVDEVHTIPLPEGWSPEIVWEHIKRGDLIPGDECQWVNIIVRDGKFYRVIDDE